MRKNIIKFIAIILNALLFISCERNQSTEAEGTLGDVNIDFAISSVEEYSDSDFKIASLPGINNEPSSISNSVESFEGFDAIAYNFQDKSDNKIHIKDKNAAIFNSGNKYRVILYEVSGSQDKYVGQYVLTSGDANSKIPVNYNRTYKWYAISYNSSEAPEEIANPSALPSFNFTNKDVLYAKGQITTTTLGNNPMGIKFKRLASRVDLIFNAVGMSAWVLDQIYVDLKVKQGQFDLKSGELKSSSDLTISTANNNYTYVDNGFQDIAKISVFTVGGAELLSINPKLKKFRVVQHNSQTTGDSEAYIFGNGTSEIGSWSFPVGTPQKAKYYSATINLVQAPITIGGVKFARGNIYDTDNATTQQSPIKNTANMRRYRLRKQNSTLNDYWKGSNYHYTDYFRFGDSRAGSAPPLLGSFFNTALDGLDPCNYLYPYDTWKTPTKAELSVLSGGTFTDKYVEFNGSGPANSPYPSHRLRLEKKGMYDNILASAPYSWDSGTSRYWSSTKEGIWIIVGNIDWYYFAEIKSNSYSVPAGYGGLGQWAQHNHYPIRCVRK